VTLSGIFVDPSRDHGDAMWVSGTLTTMSEGKAERSPSHAVRTTSRLILRRFPWTDVRAIVEGGRLDDWAPDYPHEGDAVIAGSLHRAGKSAAAVAGDSSWGHWQVLERSSGLVIGGIGFLAPPESGTVEIGYGIVPSRRGRGYATEAVVAIVAGVSGEAAITAVTAATDHDNLASQRVLEKAGFRCVGRGADLRYALTLSG